MTETFQPGQDPPAKGKGVSLEEAASTLADMAVEIEQHEKGRVEAAWATRPDPKQMRRAEVLRSAAKLIDMIIPIWSRVRTMIAPKKSDAYQKREVA